MKIVDAEFSKQKELNRDQKIRAFYDLLDDSEDLEDNLQDLVDYLKEFTGATGVYVGKLVNQKKEINDEDDDAAHNDDENPKMIQFTHASYNHEFMIGQTLDSEAGVSHDVFKESEEEEPPMDEEEEEAAQRPDVDPDLALKHIYIKEVVREPRMSFYKVPRLGAFLAVPIVYNSCLTPDALENAIQDYYETQVRKEE